ncbi:MAG: hypothetical protein WC745_02315 [Patescibacteria group bacterium]|jgi:hypothetical protein
MISLKKVNNFILNSPWTYIALISIIIIQFIFVIIILRNQNKYSYILEQTNFKTSSIENRQGELSEKMNGLQSNIMRMSAQLYRTQAPAGENN